MRTIAEHWADFERRVMPISAGEVQREETRRAFYSGAAAMLALNVDISSLSNDAAVAVLRGVQDELIRFAEAIIEGRMKQLSGVI